MNFKTKISITLLALFSLQGCVEYRDDPVCKELSYMTFEEFREKGIEVLSAQEIKNAGKIYTYNNILLVAEKNHGVHIIDNGDKKNPNPKAFIKVLGNLDMAVKDGYLYLDSYMDLVVMDIRDIDNIKEVNRTNNAFSYDPYQNLDENYYSYGCNFDRTKGIVTRGDK
jgi:hypothetical protein